MSKLIWIVSSLKQKLYKIAENKRVVIATAKGLILPYNNQTKYAPISISGNDNMRHIYRSLIVISFTVVFGCLTSSLLPSIVEILDMELPRLSVNLISAVFENTCLATTFFVYYVMRSFENFLLKFINIGRNAQCREG